MRVSAEFLLHLGASAAWTAAGVFVALLFGWDGHRVLFIPVILTTSIGGWLMRGRSNPSVALWICVPPAIWFAGWAIVDLTKHGLEHFNRVFLGAGYCGDFSCAGQLFVTSPLVGTVTYVFVMAIAGRWRRA